MDIPERAGERLPKTATVERCHQAIIVRPACAGVLACLCSAQHLRIQGPGAGFRIARVPDPLYFVRDEGQLGRVAHFSAGLEAVARLLLERAGCEVVVTGPAPTPLPGPDMGSLRGFGTIDGPLLEFVRRHDRGLIHHGPMVDPARLISQIALAYPEATITVAAARLEDVDRVARGLDRYLPSVGRGTADSGPVDRTRVVVGTYLGLGDPAVRIEHRDVLFALDAAEAAGRRPQLAIGHASRARTYGLLGRDQQPAPRDRDRIAATFGFDAIAIPRHGGQERPVEVATVKISGGPAPGADLDGAALKREGLWHHPVRNRRIVRLAAGISRGDASRTDNTFKLASIAGIVGRGPKVAILVENVEHALALAEHLPDWMPATAPDLNTVGLSKSQVERLGRCRSTDPATSAPMIVTLAALDAVDLGSLDVLIRADGGIGIPTALESIPVAADAPIGPLLLLDCDDRHHPELRRRSRGRRAAYADLGWAVDGQPAPTAIERFLASRPRRSR